MSLTHARCITSSCIVRPACRMAAADLLHCLDDFRMVGLAGIPRLWEIVWANAVEVNAMGSAFDDCDTLRIAQRRRATVITSRQRLGADPTGKAHGAQHCADSWRRA